MADRMLELGAVLIGLALAARLASRIGIPTIPLYLLAGLAFGTGGFLPLVTTSSFIHFGAEIGLILLLFMLGLEYSADELTTTMRRSARAGAIDVVANAIPGFVTGAILGWGIIPSLFLGGITLASSSGIAAKLLNDLGWTDRPEGRFVITVAIIEDLAMALYLPLLGAVVAGGATVVGFAAAIGTVAGVIIMLAVARHVQVGLSKLLFSRSDEALLLTILGIALTFAGIAEGLQVSAAVGALIAGILLSGDAARNARQLLLPLRDLFAAFFFAFIGLSVDPDRLPAMLPAAAGLALAGLGTKFITGYLGGRHIGLTSPQRRRAALLLVPRGEFSIAIAGLAVSAGVDPRIATLTVGYVLILAVIGPILVRLSERREARRSPAAL